MLESAPLIVASTHFSSSSPSSARHARFLQTGDDALLTTAPGQPRNRLRASDLYASSASISAYEQETQAIKANIEAKGGNDATHAASTWSTCGRTLMKFALRRLPRRSPETGSMLERMDQPMLR